MSQLFQMREVLIWAVGLLAACCAPCWGQFDPPMGYYDAVAGVGSVLKGQLHDIVDDHVVFSYNDARTNLQASDRDPSDPNRIFLIYNRESLDISNLGGTIPGWDSGVSWNREHTWPRSLGVGSSGADNTDMHMLRPSDPGVNSSRGNKHFGGTFGQPYGLASDDGQSVWYPGDADAGMVARQMFYAAVRYDGSDSSTEDLELTSGAPAANQLGNLDRLIEWHFAASPDEFELRRNQIVYAAFQGNRNPFIDRPEFVWSTFVDQNNDSQIAIQDAEVDANGGSLAEIDFGRAIVGSTVDTTQTIGLEKVGAAGTYFEVIASGGATSSLTGRFNAFRSGQDDQHSVTVGLSASTTNIGLATGSVAFDNLDVTGGAGIGRGANDVNDVVAMSLEVVDHATASFDLTQTISKLSLDFGQVELGTKSTPLEFDIFNLGVDIEFTAKLELDAISATGDATRFSTDLSPFLGADALAAGLSKRFTASLATDCVGEFTTDYSLTFSDEDLPGAEVSMMNIVLAGEVFGTPLAGDYDFDGDVDAEDYDIWSMSFGSTSMLDADGNGNGIVDAADATIWRDNLGSSHPTCSNAVPEPAEFLLLMLMFSACWHFACRDNFAHRLSRSIL